MKAVVGAFNQEKAPVGAFSVITNLRMDLVEALHCSLGLGLCNHVWIVRNKSPPVLTETLTDKKVKIGELVELGIAGMSPVLSPLPP